MTSVSTQRVWNTWDYRYPGAISHLPSGLTLKAAAYSGSAGRYESFHIDGEAGFRHGPHTSEASYTQVNLAHAGSELSLEMGKLDWHTIVGRMTMLTKTELLFRFQLLLELGVLPEPQLGRARRDPNEVTIEREDVGEDLYRQPHFVYATYRSQVFCLVTSPIAHTVAGHPDYDDIGNILDDKGWQHTGAPGEKDGWVSMRFSGDPLTPVTFALAQSTDRPSARAAALAALAEVESTLTLRAEEAARGSEKYKAVRDVMAWNTVWDPMDSMPYTSLARTWITQLGGRGVWMSDVLYNALMAAHVGDWVLARSNLDIVLNAAQPAGNIPCLISGFQEWIDRTQLPVASYVVYRIFLITGDLALLEDAYPVLKRQQDWYFDYRDGNGNGLLEYGSSPTGAAPYAHTRQGSINESGMDNMPIFDDAVFNEETHTLEFEEVGHNSMVALDGELLARIARELGRAEEADALEARSALLRGKISAELWDPSREIFASRHWDGQFSTGLSPTSFFPLIAGSATREQADLIVQRHLLNPDEFWGEHPLPSTPFNDPISGENLYWRGRSWPPLNLFVWEGLRRYGYHDVARDLAERGWRMFEREWKEKRHCLENFHIADPELHDSPDSDSFYSWGAILPLIGALDAADVSPWSGLSIGAQGGGHMRTPGRLLETRLVGNTLRVFQEGELVLMASPPTRVTGFRQEPGMVTFVLPDLDEDCIVTLFVDRDLVDRVSGADLIEGSGTALCVKARPGDASRDVAVDSTVEVALRSPAPPARRSTC